MFVRAGLYHIFLEDWFSVFPRDQILVIHGDDYYHDRAAVMTKVFSFLELSPPNAETLHKISEATPRNSRRHPEDMLPETRRLLGSFYAPFNKRLAELLQDDRYNWPVD